MRSEVVAMRRELESRGFFVGDRNPNRNRAFQGKFMVCEDNDPTMVTDDASTGGFCIVGDNLSNLIEDAHDSVIG